MTTAAATETDSEVRYRKGQTVSIESLTGRPDYIGATVEVHAEGTVTLDSGLISVGCHQHYIDTIVRNGGSVDVIDIMPNGNIRAAVMALGVPARSGYMEWVGGVRDRTGFSDVRSYARRLVIHEDFAGLTAPAKVQIMPGVYRCDTHRREHFFMLAPGPRESRDGVVTEMHAEFDRLGEHTATAALDEGFTRWPECRPVATMYLSSAMPNTSRLDGYRNVPVSEGQFPSQRRVD